MLCHFPGRLQLALPHGMFDFCGLSAMQLYVLELDEFKLRLVRKKKNNNIPCANSFLYPKFYPGILLTLGSHTGTSATKTRSWSRKSSFVPIDKCVMSPDGLPISNVFEQGSTSLTTLACARCNSPRPWLQRVICSTPVFHARHWPSRQSQRTWRSSAESICTTAISH